MKKIYLVFSIVMIVFSFKSKGQCSSPSTVPYYEGFQSITTNNQIPSCWAISNPSTCMTFTAAGSGNAAAFYNSPAGTSYFYSNAVQLKAGVIYSLSIWYISSSFSFSFPWTNLSVLVGTSQSALGAVTVASTSSAPSASIYTALSNTFSISNPGIYYFSVGATSSVSSGSSYLSWDDLAITVPCTPSLNSPLISILASSTVICSGTTPTFTAIGADTYTWNNGATTSTVSYSSLPPSTGIQVIGTNTLTGCTSTASINISVNPSPNVLVYASQPSICKGSSGIMTAFGATSYTWSTGQQTNTISVTPSVATSYSVIGSNNYGCTSNAVQLIQVNPLPTLTVLSAMPSNTICNGDLDTLNASGANTYTWAYSQNVSMGSQIIVTPSVTTNYSVTGKDMNECLSQTSFVLNVNGCTGLNHLVGTNYEIRIFPNPFQDEFLLSTGSNEIKAIEITDLSGRTILSLSTKEERLIVNTRYYAQGIYYMKILCGEKTSVLKVIKN